MRTIKFRGKRLDNGEWVYGGFAIRHRGAIPVILEADEDSITFRIVYRRTVGQFTGLIDKNGKEIYEGDVLDVQYNIHVDRENVCVVFGNNEVENTPGFYFSDNGKTEFGHTWDFRDFRPDIVVIGNIHDNPELMKQNE